MQLIHRPTDPGEFTCKVNLRPQDLPRLRGFPQCIQCAAHHAARRLLVVEDGERGEADNHAEERQGTHPFRARLVRIDVGEGAVGPPCEERAGVGGWGGDERAAGKENCGR